MSQSFHTLIGLTAMVRRVMLSFLAALTIALAPLSIADDFQYEALVTGGTGSFPVLVPIGSTLFGPVSINTTPGGTTTDINDLTAVILFMENPTGGALFCFNFNVACPMDTGTEVPITSITGVDLTFGADGCPVGGTIDVLAFSPTFQLNIPITLDITQGIYVADGGAIGTSTGEGNFTCNGSAPEIDTSPDPATTVTFADATIGDAVQTQDISVSNTGTSALTIGTVAIAGDADFTVTSDTCSGMAIAAASTCGITVSFTPTNAGAVTAALTIPSDDADEATVTYNFASNVLVPPGEILSDGPLVITSVDVGQTMTGIVMVTNTGAGALTVGQIQSTDLVAPFSITSDSCSASVLASMATCSITVQFAPTMAGTFMDSFDIPSDDPVTASLAVDVSSSATTPLLAVDSDPLVIADTMVNDTMTGVLTISNDGDADLDITTLTGLAAPFAIGADACTGATLAPMAQCMVTIEFSPTSVGDFSDDLSIASNDLSSPTTVTIDASGTVEIIPDISLDTMALAFSTLLVGQSEQQTVTVSNMGTGDLALTGIAIAPAGDFTSSDDCGATLAPAATCTITVTFAPTVGGALAAILNITSDDVDTPTASVSLSGNAVVPTPEISVSTTALDLGVVTVGDSTMGTVTITNDGTADLTIVSVTIPPSDLSQTNDCGVLVPTNSCTVTVTFAPTSPSTAAENLTIVSDDGDEIMTVVAVSGIGVLAPEPNIISDPIGSVDLGSVLFAQNETADITITNNGNAALNIAGVAITGVDAGEFSSTDNCVGVVAPAAMCTITVTFAPMAPEGAKAATLSVTSDDGDTPSLDFALTGTGVMPQPAVMFSTATFIFANSTVGDTALGSITVTNTGDGDLLVSGIGDTDTVDAPFSISSETCTAAAVVAGASCEINVEFSPTMVADFMDTFNFDSNDATPSRSLSLEGSAVAAAAPNISIDVTTLDLGMVLFGDLATMTATVTNTGDADLTVTATGVLPAGDFTSVSDCAVLAPAATCTIDVTYTPTTQGAATATLTIDSDDADSPSIDISLSGFGVMPEPEIEVSLTALDLGSVVVGQSAMSTVTVNNQGTGDLTLSSIVIGGTNAADFAQTNDCTTVVAGASCTVTVTYAPSIDGTSAATLSIVSNDADEGTVDVTLAGMATPIPMPMIAVDTASLDLGDVVVGQSAGMDVTVSNTGTADLSVTGVTLGGAINEFAQVNTCLGVSIAAGASCTVTVTFAPTVAGAANAQVSIASNDAASPTTVVALTGTAQAVPAPMATIDVASVDFGSVSMAQSATADVVVTNAGNADLSISSIALSGANAGDFMLPNTCGTVAAGASCTLTVTYTPSTIGVVDAQIAVATNDPALGTVTLTINATGASMEEVVVTVTSEGGNGSFALLELVLLLTVVAIARRQHLMAVLIAVGLISAPLTSAQETSKDVGNDAHWYIGGSFGSTNGQGNAGDIRRGIENAGVTVSSLSFDDSDSGYKAFFGYQATERLAVEIAYIDLGEADIDLQIGSVTLDQLPLISRAVSGSLSLLGSGMSGTVVFKQRFQENYAVFARAGLVSWEVDTNIGGSASGQAININETESGTDVTFGLGAEMWFGESRFGVRAEWERYQLGDQDAEMISIGAQFKF